MRVIARFHLKHYMDASLRDKQRKYIGALGERIAAKYLINKGYNVIGRNYRKSYGEIDIIAEKGKKVFFVEVKSVSRETFIDGPTEYRPEENVHQWKMRRLANTIQSYLGEKGMEGEWQFDVITVEIDRVHKRARCKHIPNVIL